MIVSDVVCSFCGCLCDDIELEIVNDKIVKCRNGCAISQTKFLHHSEDRLSGPEVKHGTEMQRVGLEEAVAAAAKILSTAKRPLIYGLSSTENDAHRVAYELAETIGGVIDNTSSVCHGPSIMGVQESGEPLGSLAEIRHRADLVIYWGSNPVQAHPRHLSRYILKPGEFIKDPKAEREIWVVDVRESESARPADRFIRLEPGSDLEVLNVMRALLRGHAIDVKSVGGLDLATVRELIEQMRNAKYGVLFYGLGLTQSHGRHWNVDAAIRLIQDLNEYAKWNILPMRGHYNVTGANKTSTWQTGYPFAVDFSRGYPRYQPGEFTAVDLLARGEVDAVLNVAADPVAHFPRTAVRNLARIPVINLDPKRNLTSMIATVNIPTAIAGIECDGVAVRMDGLPLYLRQVVTPPDGVLPDRDVLSMILNVIREGA